MDPKFNTRDFKLNVSFNPQQLYMPVPIRQRAARDAIAGKRVGAFSNQLLPTPKPLVNDDGDDSNGDDSDYDERLSLFCELLFSVIMVMVTLMTVIMVTVRGCHSSEFYLL